MEASIVQFLFEANISLGCLALLYILLLRRLTYFKWNRVYLFLTPIVSLGVASINIEVQELILSSTQDTGLSLADIFLPVSEQV